MANTPTQIAIYPDEELRARIEQEAGIRRRKLGPTVIEIVYEWFSRERGWKPKAKKEK